MAKKRSKLLSLLAIGAAAAGTYYYLKKKNCEIPENMDDDDDLDNFDEDVDDGPAPKTGKRSYVSLDFNTVEKKVQDCVSKVAETADKAASVIGEKLQDAAGRVEEFFDDRKPADDCSCDCETSDEKSEASEDDYEEQ